MSLWKNPFNARPEQVAASKPKDILEPDAPSPALVGMMEEQARIEALMLERAKATMLGLERAKAIQAKMAGQSNALSNAGYQSSLGNLTAQQSSPLTSAQIQTIQQIRNIQSQMAQGFPAIPPSPEGLLPNFNASSFYIKEVEGGYEMVCVGDSGARLKITFGPDFVRKLASGFVRPEGVEDEQ